MAKKTKNLSLGLEVFGRVYTKETKLLKKIAPARKFVFKAIKNNSFKKLGSHSYEFKNGGGGFSLVVNLTESHCALHTWPEYNLLTLNVYVCNFLRDNSQGCRNLFKEIAGYFEPYKVEKREVER